MIYLRELMEKMEKKKDKDTQESERKLFPHPPKTLWGLELRVLKSLPEFSHLCFVATFG